MKRMHVLAALVALALLALAASASAQFAATYTTNGNFDGGTLFNVNHNTPGTLRLNRELTTFAVMWVANAGEDSVSKIDTNTGAELARYKTDLPAAQHGVWDHAAPSRTAVDRDGNVYVANRNFHNMPASVMKILASGGIDRNNNGIIDTSTGSTPIQHVDTNANGRLENNDLRDERIAWIAYAGPVNGIGRALTLDNQGNVWLGTFQSSPAYYKLDPATGTLLAGPYYTSVQNYGAVCDSDGILWGSTLTTALVRLDTKKAPGDAGAVTRFYHGTYSENYAIAIGNGKVYLGNYACSPIVFDPATNTFSRPANCTSSYGVTLDSAGNIYTRSSTGGVRKRAPDGALLWDKPAQPGFNTNDAGNTRGLAVDANGDVWFIAIAAANNLEKYRGSDGTPLGVYSAGYMPYTYTDVTGLGSFNSSARSGKWTVIQNGGASAMHWGKVTWNTEPEGTVPAGASIVVKARAAETVAGLDAKTYVTMPNGTFLPEASELVGRYVQVEVTLSANNDDESPVLSDVRIEATPDTAPPVVTPPANASYQCVSQVPPPRPESATVTDNRAVQSVLVSSSTNGGAGTPASPLVITYTWTATDTSGNTASASQTITVIDTTAPVITLNAGPATAECHTSYVDPGATATDNCGGNVAVVASSNVDVNTPGTYRIIYSAVDAAGNAAPPKMRMVTVVDTTAPAAPTLPDLIGQCSVTAVVPNAVDSCQGAISGTTSNPLTYNAQGTFTITWTFTDNAGNSSTQTQKVIVKDTTPPVITLNPGPETFECHTTYVDAGASASDNCGGTIAVVASGNVDINTPGSYTITYSATDANGNAAAPVTRTVKVVDTTAPVPNVTSLPDLIGECSVTAVAPTANDSCQGAITATTTDATTYDAQGTFTITWTFTDNAGNSSSQTQKVIVKDTTPPVITLNPGPETFECHTSYVEAGAAATDNCGGNVAVVASGSVDINTPGSYTITYSATDENGNAAAPVTRTVKVVDTTAPVPDVATLPDLTGQCSVTAVAPTASDSCQGSITGTTTDATSYTQQGTYIVTWTYTDNAGNSSTQTQKVVVKDTIAPVATAPSAVSTTTTECTLPVPDFTTALNASDNCALGAITQSPAAGTTAGLGTTPVTVTIKDHVGNTTTFTTSFTIVNLPPVVSAGGPYSVPEGGSVLLTSIASDPSGAPVVAWDLDNDGSFETLGVTATFSAANLDGPSSYIVRVLATDSCGQTAINQATVNVTNVAPVVTITQPGSFAGFAKGTPVTVVSTFTDAGKPDTHSCSINWDNPADVAGNVAAGTVTQGAGSGSCTASYTFAQPGIYTATVTITDDDGGAGTAQVVFAVFDPNAGKVTSGFWYDSAAGASVPSPGAAGRAYGEANPQMTKGSVKGDTKFRFDAAGLDFRSTTTDWLVAVSPRAAWHGFGTIGGAGKYEFLVIAQDGKAAGDSIDRVRIRIWNPATSEVIYDNVPASSNDLDTASLQSTTSGAITVHK